MSFTFEQVKARVTLNSLEQAARSSRDMNKLLTEDFTKIVDELKKLSLSQKDQNFEQFKKYFIPQSEALIGIAKTMIDFAEHAEENKPNILKYVAEMDSLAR